MKESLDELVQYIRGAIPQPKKISHMQRKEEAQVVTFHWQGREFLVKKSLEVLELKGKALYLTGASMLLQMVLMKRSRNEKVIEGILTVLKEAEEMIASQHRSETGVKLLAVVKGSLAKLAGKKINRSEAGQPRAVGNAPAIGETERRKSSLPTLA
jgi:hypothetical protein